MVCAPGGGRSGLFEDKRKDALLCSRFAHAILTPGQSRYKKMMSRSSTRSGSDGAKASTLDNNNNIENENFSNNTARIIPPRTLMLPADALHLVMRYLTLRDLFAMTLVSRTSRTLITTDDVVRAAYMRTGDRNNTRKSMIELSKLMSANSIHPPSPLRLLRIALGKRCEFCQCRHNTLAAWSFGMFACWRCVSERGSDSLSKAWNTTWVRYKRNESKYDSVINHPRNAISTLYGKKYYMWSDHRTVAGERVGPIMAWEDIDGAVEYMEDSDESAGDYIQKIDEYIDEELRAPAVAEYEEFNRAYLNAKAYLEDTTERAEREKSERKRVREERKRKREAEQQVKEESRKQKKSAKQAAQQESVNLASDSAAAVEVEVEADEAPVAIPEQHLVIAAADDQSAPNGIAAQSGHVPAQKNVLPVTEGRRVCAACNEPKSRDTFSQTQLRNRGRFARCKVCVSTDAVAKQICSECNRSKGMTCFSREMRVGACTLPLRCMDCVSAGRRG